MSTPQTTIKICPGVRLDNSYRHTIYFDSLQKQEEYFNGKVSWTFTGYSYCRKNWSIKLNATIAKARTWSYLFFDNPEDLKTYYYFITDVKYISEETVELELEMDVIQSYLFEMRLLPSFVERETPRSDELYENTLEEDLETGLYMVNKREAPDIFDLVTVVLSSVNLNTFENDMSGSTVGEVYSGLKVYATDHKADKIGLTLAGLSAENKLDGIFSIGMYPKRMIQYDESKHIVNASAKGVFQEITSPNFYLYQCTVPDTIDGYTPKNKKLLSYPYRYIQATNNMGNVGTYRYERFPPKVWDEDDLTYYGGVNFDLYGSLLPDGGVVMLPCDYNGLGRNHEESLTIKGYPTCAWTGDTYKIWLAQNQHQQNVQLATSGLTAGAGVVMTIAGAATANPILAGSGATMAGHGLSSIAGQLAQRKDMQTYPPQASGNQSANVFASLGLYGFEILHKSITAERARVIDDFFTMYGYKVQTVKTPSIHNRKLFTYTKTIGCTVSGAFCNEDKNKISAIFDNGVTFWTNGDQIGEYSQTNGFLD